MPSGRITKRAVDSVQAGPKEFFLWDSDLKGFGFRLTPKGARSYVLQYRMGGREAPTRRYTIGSHGSPWTPDRARKEAERLLILVRQGVDPVEADKDRRRQAIDLAFDAYADSFIRLYLEKRWKKWGLGAGVLRREAVPVLGQKTLPQIKLSDFNPIWDRLQDRPAVARLAHATLRKMFRWAVARGDLVVSPLAGAEAPPAVPARDRVLTDGELNRVWAATSRLGRPFDRLFKLLILTAQRREEVAGLDWAELDQAEETWVLPGTRTKNGKPHVVPLSGPAIELLDELSGKMKWPEEGLVFSTNGRTPPSGFSKAKRRLDDFIAEGGPAVVSHWRAHDIRRTVATGLQRLGIRFEVTEAVLNHLSGARSGIAGVYQRYDWAIEKRGAMCSWGDHVMAVTRKGPIE